MPRWGYHLPILGYHRIGAFKGDHVPTVSPQTFERQLAFLVRHRYQVLSLDALVGLFDRGEPMPWRSVAITFDDGYEEVYAIAWPLLKRFRVALTLFVTPNEVGLPGFMSWHQIADMARDGVTIGSHTMNHRYLPLVSEDRLAEEIAQSKRVIEEQIGAPVHYLSYPVGGYTPLVQVAVKRAGYRAACTTNRAWSRNGMDPFALRRIKVTERDGAPLLFWAKLSGYYDVFRRLERPA